MLEVLAGAGFSPRDALKALQAVLAFVVGHALASAASMAPGEASWPRYEVLDEARFPRVRHLSRVLATHSVDDEFRFGLDCFLEGLAARGASKS